MKWTRQFLEGSKEEGGDKDFFGGGPRWEKGGRFLEGVQSF